MQTLTKQNKFHYISFLLLSLILITAYSCSDNAVGPEPQQEQEPKEEPQDTPAEITGDKAVEVMIEVLRDRGLSLPSADSTSNKGNTSKFTANDFIL